jgi:CHAT domain-containing protein/Tfp pilus assembly protein PilF
LLVFILLSGGVTAGETINYTETIQHLDELTKKQRYDEAMRYGYSTLEKSIKQNGTDHPHTGKLRQRLANLYGLNTTLEKVPQDTLRAFEKHLRQALDFYRNADFRDPLLIANTTYNLAYLLAALNKNEAAAAMYVEAIQHYQRIGAGTRKQLGITHQYLASVYMKLDRSSDAISSYNKALEILGNNPKANFAWIDHIINKLAQLHVDHEQYNEADSLYHRLLKIRIQKHGHEHADVGNALVHMSRLYKKQGRTDDAIDLHKRALAIFEKVHGKQHLYVARGLTEIAVLHTQQHRYIETEPLLKQALTIYEHNHGKEHYEVAVGLINLARAYQLMNRPDLAEPLQKRALEIKQKTLNESDMQIATSMDALADIYVELGQYNNAEKIQKQSLAFRQKVLEKDDPSVADTLKLLATIYRYQGRYDESGSLLQQALSIQNKSGENKPAIADIHDNLGLVYHHQGHYTESEAAHKQALRIREIIYNKTHPDIATSLANLAGVYNDQGRYAESEPLIKRALVIFEKSYDRESPAVAITLNNLSNVYRLQGRYTEAIELQKRTLAIRKKVNGEQHPDVAVVLNNLAVLYKEQDHDAEAESHLLRALEIREQTLGKQHPLVATTLANLASVYKKQARNSEAIPLYQRALVIKESVYGKSHPDIATILDYLGSAYQSQGLYDKSEPLHLRALSIREEALGKQHPDVANSLNYLAVLYGSQGRYATALEYARKVSVIFYQRFTRPQATHSSGIIQERQSVRTSFLNHIWVITQLFQDKTANVGALIAEALEVGQLARSGGAAQALAQMAARFATSGDTLALRVREHQDALAHWQRMDEQLTRAFSEVPDRRQPEKEERLRTQLAALDERLLSLEAALARDFPEYTALTNPAAVTLAEVQDLLHADEAILGYLTDRQDTFLFVVRKGRHALYRIDLNATELDTIVKALRKGLDSDNMLDESGNADPQQHYHDLPPYRIPRFDIEQAHALYQKLIAPAEPLLKDAKHIMIIPDGALTSLPFGVLVTEKPAAPIKRLRQYRKVAWLARKYAISTLPSIGALRVLRHFAKRSKADKPLVGFGDPLLGETGKPTQKSSRGMALQTLYKRGPIADADTLRNAFTRLPDTRLELQAIADTLNTKHATLYLQERATESRVRSMVLSPYRVVAFATHGLMAGEFKGVAEPALVLTPPETGSQADDGLLTASEVAQLKLNADWVILSACNTAAADGTPGAQGLSGLARAFFYAGSRALLVSHWYVISDATRQLQTRMFQALSREPGLGRAEALQRAREQLITDRQRPYFAHPMFWAPFVVVGEGGAG